VVVIVCRFDGNGNVDGGGSTVEGGVEGGSGAAADGGRGLVDPMLVLARYLVPQTKSFMVVVLKES
jgi:hypothetical protein